jgi:hypothetical protein
MEGLKISRLLIFEFRICLLKIWGAYLIVSKKRNGIMVSAETIAGG